MELNGLFIFSLLTLLTGRIYQSLMDIRMYILSKYIRGEENVVVDALFRIDMGKGNIEAIFAFEEDPLPPFHTSCIKET